MSEDGRGREPGDVPSDCACRNTLAMASTYVACESRLRVEWEVSISELRACARTRT